MLSTNIDFTNKLIYSILRCCYRLFLLKLFLDAALCPDYASQQDEGHGRQDHQVVGNISEAVQDIDSEEGAASEKFTEEGHHDEHKAVSGSVGETVEQGGDGFVGQCERFDAAHHDTVGDNQADVHRKLFVNGVKVFDLGFGKDEDFDGIKGKELSEYVGSNSLYYLPVFSSIHKRNVSKFHVAAFLFNGSWYIFRKQYLKGALLMIVTTLLYVLNEFISYFYANPMWEKATDAIRAAANGGSALGASWMPQWSEYMSWMAQNCSFWEGALMMLPYVLSLISWVIMFVCGFKANKGYYKAVRKNIKKIKEDNPDKTEEEIAGLISAKGGTSIGMAWMLTACQAIILGAFVMFIAR